MDEEPPPPPYTNHGTEAPTTLYLYYDPGLTSETREMYLKTTPSAPGSKTKAYHVAFPQTASMARMHIHRGDQNGPIIAQVHYDNNPGEDYHIKTVWADGTRLYIGRLMEGGQTRLKVTLGDREYSWTVEGEHAGKGKKKGKGMENVNLVDQDEKVAASFVNEWKGAGVEEHRVGHLKFLGDGAVDSAFVDQVVVTLVALVERILFMRSARRQELREVAAILLCVVS